MSFRAVCAVGLSLAVLLGATACRRPELVRPDRVAGAGLAGLGDPRQTDLSPSELHGAPAGFGGPVDLGSGRVAWAPTPTEGPAPTVDGVPQPDAMPDATPAPSPGADSVPTPGAEPEVQAPGPALPPPPPQPRREIVRAPSNVTTGSGLIQSPADGAAVPPGPLTLRLGGNASDHYIAQIDAHLARLVAGGSSVEIGGLSPGPHVLRLIPADGDGVTSLDKPQIVQTFTIGTSAQPVPGFSPAGPILNIGRPFGQVRADAIGAVLMDVRVDGVKLSEAGTMLKYKLDATPDEEASVVSDYPPKRPVQLFDLAPGPHMLTAWLELDGRRVENGGVTRVEREFTVLP